MPRGRAPSIQSPRPRLLLSQTLRFSSWLVFPLFVCVAALQLLPPREPLRDFLFEPERAGLIEHAPPEAFGQVLLRDVCLWGVMCVLIPRVISQFLHQLGDRKSVV